MMAWGKTMARFLIQSLLELLFAPGLFGIALLARFLPKQFDIGLGPEPIINNIYHKKALQLYGYSAETFVLSVFYITSDFDIRADQWFPWRVPGRRYVGYLYVLVATLVKYRCLYLYFNGGVFGFSQWLWRVEPWLYRLANVKVVVMPYGSDVQEMSRASNLLYKHAIARDYPRHRFNRRRIAAKIDLWTRHAHHIIAGCDWVDYLYYWDTLMLAHFSIDLEQWKPQQTPGEPAPNDPVRPLRILHAPNHRTIKGTQFFLRAVEELQAEGVAVELILLERMPNHKIKEVMESVDVVADQLIIGWFAMFAIEGMALEKPVLCYLRPEFVDLFTTYGLLTAGEIPIINCTPLTVKTAIRDLALNRDQLAQIGRRSREFVTKHHSTAAIGKVFDQINQSLGLMPSNKSEQPQ
jgi:glycosyltransferase involved in cell wall biosynthesis